VVGRWRTPGPPDHRKGLHDALEVLAEAVESLIEDHRPATTRLVFAGGGSLVLPAWFLARMTAAGVRIELLQPGAQKSEPLQAENIRPNKEPTKPRYQHFPRPGDAG